MAVLLPTFQVSIKSTEDNKTYMVKAISQINVNLSAEKPCDSAEVHIPTIKKSMIKDKDGNDLSVNINPGDEIEIGFGYIGETTDLVTVFSGLVSWVSPDIPLVIKAEDNFRKAKHNYVNKEFGTDAKPIWYSEIAEKVLGKAGLEAYIPLAKLDGQGDWKTTGLDLKKQTVAQAMEKLSQDTEWVHFLIPGTKEVYFGPPFPYKRGFLPRGGAKPSVLRYRIGSGRLHESRQDTASKQSYPWGNIISASGLEYQSRKPYRRVVCNLVDTRFTSKSVEKEALLPEEEECEEQDISFTAHYEFQSSKAANEAEALRRAQERLDQLNAAQYTGSFATFGNPKLKHSHIFRLESAEKPKINDLYDAKAVTFNYSPSGGFRMTVEVRKPPENSNNAKQGG